MRTKSLYLLAVVLVSVALTGCEQLQHPSAPFAPQRSSYAMTTSADGTFILDQQAGKAWRYSAKDEAFLEVPVTSKILKYERGPDGKPRLVDPKKDDPLGIR